MQQLVLLSLLAVLPLVIGIAAPPPSSVCKGVSCSSCLAQPGCLWCRNLQQCFVNTSTVCEDCSVTPGGLCPVALCSSHTDCGSCTSDPACGWCDDTSTCYESVACPDCLPGGRQCSVWKSGGSGASNCSFTKPCSSYPDCETCNEDPSCGWCGDTQICALAWGAFECGTDCSCFTTHDASSCPANHTSCSDYHDCYDCTQQLTCGWCPVSLRCMASDTFGPCGDQSCSECFIAGGDVSSCPPQGLGCSDYNNCFDCTQQASCGWCPGTSTCYWANDFGPCSGAECNSCWQYGSEAECPVANTTCSDYKDCFDCTLQDGCGWCSVTNECTFGTFAGPCNGECESCWQYGSEAECPSPHEFCSNFTDCAGCTAQNGCGWCPTSQLCTPGTSFGECSGNCENCWQYGDDSDCPAPHTTCANYSSCATCTAQDGCGWCATNSICVPGTSFSPCSSECESCWQYGSEAECPAANTLCSDYSDCASCTAQSGCGWCPQSEECIPGSDFEPCSGSSCSCWTTTGGSCPSSGSCPDFKSQSQCTSQPGCTWCTNTKQCVWGTGSDTCSGAYCEN